MDALLGYPAVFRGEISADLLIGAYSKVLGLDVYIHFFIACLHQTDQVADLKSQAERLALRTSSVNSTCCWAITIRACSM